MTVEPFELLTRQPLVVGLQRTVIRKGPAQFAEVFRERRAFLCSDLFEPALCDKLVQRARTTRFQSDHVLGLGTREVEAPQVVGGAINLLLQRTEFLRWIEQATGRGPLVTVEGRVVQTHARATDELRWHDDLTNEPRALGITINLSGEPYTGGDFEFRNKGRSEPEWTFHHEKVGAALIFDIQRDLEHRLTPLQSGGPRRVYTGWFMKEPF